MSPSTSTSPRNQATPLERRATSDSDARSTDDQAAVPVHERCKYTGKYCGRARAQKSNGTFHRLCQHHREKANANQKRWKHVRRKVAVREQQRRRVQELVAEGHFASSPRAIAIESSDEWSPPTSPSDPVEFNQWTWDDTNELSPEDVAILHVLLDYDREDMDWNPTETTCEAETCLQPRSFDWGRFYSIPHNFWNIR